MDDAMAQHASTLSPPIAVSPGEAARLLGLSRQYVYHLIEVGKLRRFKIGRAARVPYADVVASWSKGSRTTALSTTHPPRNATTRPVRVGRVAQSGMTDVSDTPIVDTNRTDRPVLTAPTGAVDEYSAMKRLVALGVRCRSTRQLLMGTFDGLPWVGDVAPLHGIAR